MNTVEMLGYKKSWSPLWGVRKKVSFSVQDSTGSVCVCLCVCEGRCHSGWFVGGVPASIVSTPGSKQGRLRLRSLVFVAPRLRPWRLLSYIVVRGKQILLRLAVQEACREGPRERAREREVATVTCLWDWWHRERDKACFCCCSADRR